MVCGVVLQKDGKFLLVQEKNPKVYGKWNLPGGYVDQGETLEEAAIREAFEEVGLKVEIIRQLLVLHRDAQRPVLHAYAAEIISGELHSSEEELLDAQWFSLDEIRMMKDQLREVDYVLGAVEAVNR